MTFKRKLITAAVLLLGLVPASAAAITPADKAHLMTTNLLVNPGFEAGLADFSASGGSLTKITGASALFGAASARFNASASAQTVTSGTYTVPAGLVSRPCLAAVSYITSEATNLYRLRALDGSNNVLGYVDLNPVSVVARAFVPFLCPSSGSVKWQLYSQGDAADLDVDMVWIGEENRLASLSQAEFVGSVKWSVTASCIFTSTNASYADYGPDTDCDNLAISYSGRAVADAVDPGQRPQIRFLSLPPGRYLLKGTGAFYAEEDANNGARARWRFHDGTAALDGENAVSHDLTSETDVDAVAMSTITGETTYTTAKGDTTFKIQAQLVGGDRNKISVDGESFMISVYRFPLESEEALTIDTVNLHGTLSYPTTASCQFDQNAGTYTDLPVDADCSPGTATGNLVDPGTDEAAATARVLLPGTYMMRVHGNFNATGSSVATQDCYWILTDGTSGSGEMNLSKGQDLGNQQTSQIMGRWTYTSVQVNKKFELQAKRLTGNGNCRLDVTTSNLIFELVALDQNIPGPVTFGGLVNSDLSGKAKVAWAVVDISCTSSPCTIASQSGGFTNVVRNSLGNYTANFVGGTFTTAPSCHATPIFGTGEACFIQGVSIPTTSSWNFLTRDGSGSVDDRGFTLTCHGAG